MQASSNAGFLCLAALAVGAGYWIFAPAGERSSARSNAGEETTSQIPAESSVGPLTFAAPSADLGSISEPIHHPFVYENHGAEAVTILDIKTSCGCMVARPERSSVQPGEKGQIVVTLDPSRQAVGRHTQTVELEFEGGGLRRRIRLQVRYHNRPDVVAPKRVAIQTTAGQAGSARFDIIDYRDKPLKIASAKSSSDRFRVRVNKQPDVYLPGWRYELEVTTASDTPVGAYGGSILIRTDDPQRALLTIPVEAHHAPRLRVSPTTLHLVRKGSSASGRLFVTDALGEPLEIEKVSTSDTRLAASIERPADSNAAVVELRYDEKPPGVSPAMLTVRIVVRLPVRKELCIEVCP